MILSEMKLLQVSKQERVRAEGMVTQLTKTLETGAWGAARVLAACALL